MEQPLNQEKKIKQIKPSAKSLLYEIKEIHK